MNAILQSLSHCRPFSWYFLQDDAYRRDRQRRNRDVARRFGTRGEVTESLAALLRSMSEGSYAQQHSKELLTAVEKWSEFSGGAEQDAQEFLLWLIDKLHEDLNLSSGKRSAIRKKRVRVYLACADPENFVKLRTIFVTL